MFENFVPDCVRSNLIGCIFSLGGHAPDPRIGTLHTTIIVPPSCFPCYLKILYEPPANMHAALYIQLSMVYAMEQNLQLVARAPCSGSVGI